jgi:serine/threonine protein phosphatase PrpC
LNALPIQVDHRSFAGKRSRNEDHVACLQLGSDWCLVLSDGAGGHRDGTIAAHLVVDRVLQGFRARPPRDAEDLAELLHDAHEALRAEQGDASGAGAMHATIVVLLLDPARGRALWAHVGDSRLYLLRRGCIDAMTRDDSVVQQMVDAGLLDARQARGHPHRNRLLAALGIEGELTPNVGKSALADGDVFLLCSDGWWEAVEEGQIESELRGAESLGQWLDAMAQTVERHAEPDQDNYSAVACWVGDPSQTTLMPAGQSSGTGADAVT